MTTADGNDVTEITALGNDVTEVTVDGDVVWRATPDVEVLADFETGDLSDWSGNTGNYEAQSDTVLEGSYSLRSTGSWGTIVHDGLTPEPGYQYRIRLQSSGGGDDPQLLVQCQNTTNRDDTYLIWVDAEDDQFIVRKRVGGATDIGETVSVSLTDGNEYWAAIEYAASGDEFRGVVYDASGTELATSGWIADSSPLTGGSLGVYTSTDGTIFDYLTRRPL